MDSRAQYNRLLANRHALVEANRFSAEPAGGSSVAILMSFVDGLSQNDGDSFDAFAAEANHIEQYYIDRDFRPEIITRAVPEDFARVMQDPDIPTVVFSGFGSLSSIAVPVSREVGAPYGYIDFLHLSNMADHLKRGRAILSVCGTTPRNFNPPLPCGVVSSLRNVFAPPLGEIIRAEGDDAGIDQLQPVTDNELDELSYKQMKDAFKLQRNWEGSVVSSVPDPVYIGVRALYNHTVNRTNLPKPIQISYGQFVSDFVQNRLNSQIPA